MASRCAASTTKHCAVEPAFLLRTRAATPHLSCCRTAAFQSRGEGRGSGNGTQQLPGAPEEIATLLKGERLWDGRVPPPASNSCSAGPLHASPPRAARGVASEGRWRSEKDAKPADQSPKHIQMPMMAFVATSSAFAILRDMGRCQKSSRACDAPHRTGVRRCRFLRKKGKMPGRRRGQDPKPPSRPPAWTRSSCRAIP